MAAEMSERTSHCRMQLEALDATELQHPADAAVGADDSKRRVVAADPVQRCRELAQHRRVDVICRSQIHGNRAAAGGKRSFTAASECEDRDGLDPSGQRDDRDTPVRPITHGVIFLVC
jgi:hypothetical protein